MEEDFKSPSLQRGSSVGISPLSNNQPEPIRDAIFDNSIDPLRADRTPVGIPGKTSPYPLEEDELNNTDHYEDFKDLRNKLMQHAKILADQLITTDENINLRSLAFARILDRIFQLDTIIPALDTGKVIRIEYVYNGSVHNVPPWHDTQPDNPTSDDDS